MKLKFLSLFLALGLAFGTQVKAADSIPTKDIDPQTKDVITDMLVQEGHSKEDIAKEMSKAKFSLCPQHACDICVKVAGYVGDDAADTCGGNAPDHNCYCAKYMATTLVKFVLGKRVQACKALDPKMESIRDLNKTLASLLTKACERTGG